MDKLVPKTGGGEGQPREKEKTNELVGAKNRGREGQPKEMRKQMD